VRVVGQLLALAGQTLTISTQKSGKVVVNVTANAAVQQVQSGALTGVKVGDCLKVVTTTDSQGNLTAVSVQDVPGSGNDPCHASTAAPSASASTTSNNAGIFFAQLQAIGTGSMTVQRLDGTQAGVAITSTTTVVANASLSAFVKGHCIIAIGSQLADGSVSASQVEDMPWGTGDPSCGRQIPSPSPH
jgi:hypothetical protein